MPYKSKSLHCYTIAEEPFLLIMEITGELVDIRKPATLQRWLHGRSDERPGTGKMYETTIKQKEQRKPVPADRSSTKTSYCKSEIIDQLLKNIFFAWTLKCFHNNHSPMTSLRSDGCGLLRYLV